MARFPKDLFYTKSYVWMKVCEDVCDEVLVGVVEKVVEQSKQIVFLELPCEGVSLKGGENLVSFETAKLSGHLSLPFSVKVVEVNSVLEDEPERLESDCYLNWLVRVKLLEEVNFEEFLSCEEAEDFYG